MSSGFVFPHVASPQRGCMQSSFVLQKTFSSMQTGSNGHPFSSFPLNTTLPEQFNGSCSSHKAQSCAHVPGIKKGLHIVSFSPEHCEVLSASPFSQILFPQTDSLSLTISSFAWQIL